MSEKNIRIRQEAWSGGDTRLAKAVARPMVRFLAQETASGVLLLLATAVALIWVNLPGELGESYERFWGTYLDIRIGDWEVFHHSLEHTVNDLLMVLFFFVVGMEIKSELVNGELRSPRVAALPAIAAIGGMVVPALLYVAVTAGTDGVDGWGVPMATDIAFAVGVLALLGPIVPQRLKLFLLTLAIVDDIGAILVIAVFYSAGIAFDWLALAVFCFLLTIALKYFRVWYIPVYVVIGIVIWYATLNSGVHATIAGVVLGLSAPARPLLQGRAFEPLEDIFSGDNAIPAAGADLSTTLNANWRLRESLSPTNRLTGLISPWSSFVIVPIFALANAGIKITPTALADAATSRVTLGIVVGLVIGKPLGIGLASWFGLATKVAEMPPDLTMRHIVGAGAVSGIGFTVALFISKLAFMGPDGEPLASLSEAIMGVLVASILATIVGWLILRRGSKVLAE